MYTLIGDNMKLPISRLIQMYDHLKFISGLPGTNFAIPCLVLNLRNNFGDGNLRDFLDVVRYFLSHNPEVYS